MGLFDETNGEGANGESYVDVLSPDPASPLDGEVEPALVPGLAPSPARVGLYGAHGAIEESFLVEKSDEANFSALARATYDGLAQLEIAIRRLNRKRLILGPFAWTPTDTQLRFAIPADRLPINAQLSRIVALLTDASAAAEVLTITDLLPVAISYKPASVLDESIVDDAGVRLGIPTKAESFTLTKKGGGAFTTAGVLYLVYEEGGMT